jgi:pyridinium-3,5-biscarboxylic acid mononucleotide sulfurtransferase
MSIAEIENHPADQILLPEDALRKLREWMRTFNSALVAYSGGVDSALVLALAHDALGPRALGCIGVSPSYPKRELDAATDLAQQRGFRYRLVNTEEHLDSRYAANPGNRCYFCKSELYDRLSAIRAEEGADVILDGTNASDLGGHRPGYAAAKERGVRSPLAELGINKERVRQLAQRLDLPVWDKPASPCLASRVPTGVAIVPLLLLKIEKAEDALAALGFKDFRVRHHGDVARIELPAEALAIALEKRDAIVEGVRAAGYKFVSLDLGGLKSGSLSG